MSTDKASEIKTYALDTNVLLHDPACLFRFEDNNIFIPWEVLEELDKAKKAPMRTLEMLDKSTDFLLRSLLISRVTSFCRESPLTKS